jgi:hypothetical protein
MKKTLSLSCLLVFLIGCTAQSEKQADQVKTDTVDPEFTHDAAMYREAAERLVGEFADTLKGELMAALSEGDAVNALGVCATKAPEIVATHAVGRWSVRRVSDRSRNPDNRASTTEAVILLGFADSATAPPFVETWEGPDSLRTYHFYKPIHTVPLCLMCHGGLQTMAPGVMAALRDKYPQDRATGYKAGELRGMFVVEATWPDGKTHAEYLLTDSLRAE